MLIAVDFDDVLVNTGKTFVTIATNKGYDIEYRDMTDWDIASVTGIPKQIVQDIYKSVDYRIIDNVPGADTALKALTAAGHQIVIVTHNWQGYSNVARQMTDRFGDYPIAMPEDKLDYMAEHDVDYWIDDKWVDELEDISDWCNTKVLLMSRPWNVKYDMPSGVTRVGGWDDILDFILEDTLQEEIITNDNGGQQSKIAGRFDLLPYRAVKEVAVVLEEGAAKYSPNNWRQLDIDSILNHAMLHQADYMLSANLEDLSHAACRLLMALELHIQAEEDIVRDTDTSTD